jgi:hypothetical protein
MVSGSMSGNNLHFACARCRLRVPGWQPAARSFLTSSIWVRGWCFSGSCSSAMIAVANASVTTHSSWPVIPFLGIRLSLSSLLVRVHPSQGRRQDAGQSSRTREGDGQRRRRVMVPTLSALGPKSISTLLAPRPSIAAGIRIGGPSHLHCAATFSISDNLHVLSKNTLVGA